MDELELAVERVKEKDTRLRLHSSQEIYAVSEGLHSPRTIDAYRKSFRHFLDYIKIHDLQVLLDYSPKDHRVIHY